MHERHEIERRLRREAERISEDYDGAPVVIIVGGKKDVAPRCMTASTLRPEEGYRLCDLLGILQTVMQIETFKHFHIWGKLRWSQEAIKKIARETGVSLELQAEK